MARPDSDDHVIVPKFVKDRLIRIETRMFDFHDNTTTRLDGISKDIEHLSRKVDMLVDQRGK